MRKTDISYLLQIFNELQSHGLRCPIFNVVRPFQCLGSQRWEHP